MDKEERLPTVKEVRNRINNMDISRRNGVLYQNAFRYIYLVAGRVSELAGSYRPVGNNAYKVKIEDTDAVLFLVKTARKKGKIRPIAVPLDEKYEPWSRKLLKWFEVYEESPAFGGLTMRSFQREAGLLFDGLMWPVEEYRKSVYVPRDKLNIIRDRARAEGGIEYLVEYPNGERHWVDTLEVKVDTEYREPHWRPFSLQSLRQLRIWELKYLYGFSDTQINIYTGFSSTKEDLRIPGRNLSSFFGSDQEDNDPLNVFVNLASSYYRQLLKPRE